MPVTHSMRRTFASLSLLLMLTACATPEGPAADSGWTVTEIATGLDTPWDIAWLPDGRMIVTERNGRIVVREDDGPLREIARINNVTESGESGLTGIAIDPSFNENNFLFVQYSYRSAEGVANRVSRFTLRGGILTDERILLNALPGGSIHNGGRIRIGPDKKLWILTGDAGMQSFAEDLSSLGGKVLRMELDGSIPADNPFPGSLVYSFGHRNPQGIAWAAGIEGPFVAEHGQSAYDELNLLEPGADFGWPAWRECDGEAPIVTPVLCSGAETWAPSGIAIASFDSKTYLFMTGLRGAFLRAYPLRDGKLGEPVDIITNRGRIRAASVGPDGMLYVSTSNWDGRGRPRRGDDKLLRIEWR